MCLSLISDHDCLSIILEYFSLRELCKMRTTCKEIEKCGRIAMKRVVVLDNFALTGVFQDTAVSWKTLLTWFEDLSDSWRISPELFNEAMKSCPNAKVVVCYFRDDYFPVCSAVVTDYFSLFFLCMDGLFVLLN